MSVGVDVHPCLSYYLFVQNQNVVDNGADLPIIVSKIFHDWEAKNGTLPNFIGSIVRNSATTQKLSLTQQMESGIRFIDFRIMFSAPPNATDSGLLIVPVLLNT